MNPSAPPPSPSATRPVLELSLPLRLGFGLAVFALIVISVLSYQSLLDRARTVDRLTHSLEIVDETNRLLSVLKDAETGQRGYLLTQREEYLKPYENAVAAAPMQIIRLRSLLSDTPRQQERLVALEQVIHSKMHELQDTITLTRSGRLNEAVTRVQTDVGKQYMDQIRGIIQEMLTDQHHQLEQQSDEWRRTATLGAGITWGGSALLIVLILGAAQMTRRETQLRNIEGWLRGAESTLAKRLIGEQSPQQAAQHILDHLALYMNASVGALYSAQLDRNLIRAAAYGISNQATLPESIHSGEGLLGQAAAQNRAVVLTDVPGDYLKASSALGERAPVSVIAFPLRAEGLLQAVVELGFFRKPADWELGMLERISEPGGSALRTARYRTHVQQLLEETQRQAEELQTQQEELRVSNEELEEQGKALRESQAKMEGQQSELEQLNAHLEEQTQQVETQRDELVTAQGLLIEKNVDLERTSRYKSEFLANMSHELRTPLNSSLILAKLLSENRTGNLNPEQIKFADTIYNAGNDLLTLINDILDLSKIEAGKVDVHVESVTVASLLEALRLTFNPVANQRGLTFQLAADPDAPVVVETDRQRVEQILKNLLSNAFKFCERGGVSVQVRPQGPGEVDLIVRDTGVGIPPDQLQRIFEAFHQVESHSRRKYGGTGLGLSISRDLSHLLGGELLVESVPQQGSSFTLRLPRVYAAASGKVATAPVAATAAPEQRLRRRPTPVTADAPSGGQRTLLIVEDDPTFAQVLSDLGTRQQFRCIIATRADEAFQLALSHTPSAIVLDIGLPDHSGLSVLDRLKRNPRTRHIPVHVVSGQDSAQTAMEMGAVGYALKPVPQEQLEEALRKLAAKASQQTRRILVVEDDAVQRDAVTRLLQSDGVEAIAVATAKDALQRLSDTTLDCMVLDLNLPDASGYELLEAMAKGEGYAFPPVIVYTGRSLSREEEERLRRYSRSIIIKGARSPERLLDEATLFLHQVESQLPAERKQMLKEARNRETLFENRRILLVEDDVRNIFALTHVLEPRGVKLELARNGREALDFLATNPVPDLVLMDIMMPEMDGYQAMQAIRRKPELDKLPIIALTAKAMPDDQEKCLQAGANDYVAKPIDVDKLLSLIRVWMPK